MFFEVWITFLPVSAARLSTSPSSPTPELAKLLAAAGFYLIDGQGTRAWVLRSSHRFSTFVEAGDALRSVLAGFGLPALVELLQVTAQQTLDLRTPADAAARSQDPPPAPLAPAVMVPPVRVREPRLLPATPAVPAFPQPSLRESSAIRKRRQAPEVPQGFSITEVSARRRAMLAAAKLRSLIPRKP